MPAPGAGGAGPVPSEPPPAAKFAAGTEVSVAGLRIRCKALLGRGSFSEAPGGELLVAPWWVHPVVVMMGGWPSTGLDINVELD